MTLENIQEASIKGGEGVKEKVPGARPRARVAQRSLCPGTALSPGALLSPAALAPKVSSALGQSSTGHSTGHRDVSAGSCARMLGSLRGPLEAHCVRNSHTEGRLVGKAVWGRRKWVETGRREKGPETAEGD